MNKLKENIGKYGFMTAAIICVIAVIAIFSFLIYKSIPAFGKIGLLEFIFGETWSPDRLDTMDSPLSGTYGIFTMIIGTLSVTVGALLIGGIFGYFTAIFLAFYCPIKLKGFLGAVINLLAGIPSVVYGFFGIAFLLPLLSNIAPNNGSGLLATSIILVIGRALGETMAVVMIAGNSPTYPKGLFSSFRVLTANIVMEMGYAGEVQEAALVATGVVLLLFVLFVNLIFGAVSKKAVASVSKKESKVRVFCIKGTSKLKNVLGMLSHKVHFVDFCRLFALFSGLLASLSLIILIGFIAVKGVPVLIENPSLIYGKYEFASENITVFPAIVTTLYAVVLSLVLAVPIGIMTAIFLHEYTKKDNFFVRIIRTAIDILAGVPSIVYGLFGMITFVKLFGGSSSILAGSVTVSMMLLPTVVRSTEESLRSVSDSLREGSLALGAGKLRTIFKIVIPSALPGILSAIILSMGRVISESAPFLYTAGSVISAIPKSPLSSGATLSVALYQLSGEGWCMDEAYATAVILIVIVLSLNFIAERCAKGLGKKLQGGNHGK